MKIKAETYFVIPDSYGAWSVTNGSGRLLAFDLGNSQAQRVMNLLSIAELDKVTILRNVASIKRRFLLAMKASDLVGMAPLIRLLNPEIIGRELVFPPRSKKWRGIGNSRKK